MRADLSEATQKSLDSLAQDQEREASVQRMVEERTANLEVCSTV